MFFYLLKAGGTLLFILVLVRIHSSWRRAKPVVPTPVPSSCSKRTSHQLVDPRVDDNNHHDTQVSSDRWLPEDDSDVLSRIDGGPGRAISSLAFLAGGRRIATSRQGGSKIRLWDVENDRVQESFLLCDNVGAVIALSACNDGKHIVSGHDHGKVVIWNIATHPSYKVSEWRMEGKLTALGVSLDSLRVASGSEEGTVFIWSMQKRGLLLGSLKHHDSTPISSVKFSPAGGRIASAYRLGGDTCSIRIWHSRTGTLLESIRDSQSTYSLAWSMDGRRLFAGGPGGLVKCFDLSTQILSKWRAPSRDLISSLYVSHNGQFLISVSSGSARFLDTWDIRNNIPGKRLRSRRGVSIMNISPDDTRIVCVGQDNEITMRSLSTILERSHIFNRLFPLTKESDPFTYVSKSVREAIESGQLVEAEQALSKEIEDGRYGDFVQYNYANRALVRLRNKNWKEALEDAEKAMRGDCQIPLIAYIVKAVALHGQQDIDGATRVFESALHACDNNSKHTMRCIKSLALCNLEYTDGVQYDPKTDPSDDIVGSNLTGFVEAHKYFFTAQRHMDQKDYEKVFASLKEIPDLVPLIHIPEMNTMSLIFGRNLEGLICGVHKLRCQTLFELRRPPEVLHYFTTKEANLSEELEAIMVELSLLSEAFGDEARSNHRYGEAQSWYTEALTLIGCTSESSIIPVPDTAVVERLRSLPRCLRCTAHLFAKRSEVRVMLGMWLDALTDADWVILIDPLYPSGYVKKYAALYGMGRFEEASAALHYLGEKFPDFGDAEVQGVRSSYRETVKAINKQIETACDASPFVLIHVADGLLCDRLERIRRFEADPVFYKLVSSMTTDTSYIKEAVENYFRYVMFSHTWDEYEPSFEDVARKSVYEIQNDKLRTFCEKVRDDFKPYQWSWSDTCCIDKKNTDSYQKSIRSMYKWYQNSALTIVRLARPSESYPSLDLEHNRWMHRAWTLQELLAPEVIRFYDYNWGLYLQDTSINHKTSPKIKPELARATGVEPDALVHFSPKSLPVRHRLRLASGRKASVEVDIAYALIGIFSSDIHVEYTREAEVALGLLLQERVNRQGDVTVLDWVGKPSTFHSSLPADISVYSQTPYTVPLIPTAKLGPRVDALKALPKQDVIRLYDNLLMLGLPRFADRRLSLPSITFPVISIQPDTSIHTQGPPAYFIITVALGNVKFKTRDFSVSELPQARVVLVYPWIRDLFAAVRDCNGNKYIQALSLLAYLEQGFRAMLFAEQSHQQYKRIASDEVILVPTHQWTSLEEVGIEVLEVWETS